MTERPRITINMHVDNGLELRVDLYHASEEHGYVTLVLREADDAGYGQDVTVFIPRDRIARTAQALLGAAVELAKLAGGELLFGPHLTGTDHERDSGGQPTVSYA